MNRESDRELDEDTQRRQLLVPDAVRRYLKEQTKGEMTTYSQKVEEWLPQNPEEVTHGYGNREIAYLKLTPELADIITGMAGRRVDGGDVLTYYAFLAALENEDFKRAAEFSERIPDLLWDLLDQLEVTDD